MHDTDKLIAASQLAAQCIRMQEIRVEIEFANVGCIPRWRPRDLTVIAEETDPDGDERDGINCDALRAIHGPPSIQSFWPF